MLLVIVVSWAVVSLIAFAAWFLIMSAGPILQLLGVLTLVAGAGLVWRQVRRRPNATGTPSSRTAHSGQ